MELCDLIQRFSRSRADWQKAVFSTLFIGENKLRTLFDKEDPNITLKQFMLLVMLRQSQERMTFTQLGKLLGCSRQNIKKLAQSLERKGFVVILQQDRRASYIQPTQKLREYFGGIAGSHQRTLDLLFSVYTDKEMEQLFLLLMKLYDGIELLERSEAEKANPEHPQESRENRRDTF